MYNLTITASLAILRLNKFEKKSDIFLEAVQNVLMFSFYNDLVDKIPHLCENTPRNTRREDFFFFSYGKNVKIVFKKT